MMHSVGSWSHRKQQANGQGVTNFSSGGYGRQIASSNLAQHGQRAMYNNNQQHWQMQEPQQDDFRLRKADPRVGEKLSKQEQYRLELDEQVRLKEERKRREREVLQRQKERELQEMNAYNPFGRGGAGAPLRDGNGNILSEFRHSKDGHVRAIGMTPGQQQQQAPSPNLLKVPPLEIPHHNYLPGMMKSPKQENQYHSANKESESARFSRFQFALAPPEEQIRIQEKARKQQEASNFLREQLEEKKRRQAMEKAQRDEEERLEEERLERERAELRMAFEREKGRHNGKYQQQQQDHVAVTQKKNNFVASPKQQQPQHHHRVMSPQQEKQLQQPQVPEIRSPSHINPPPAMPEASYARFPAIESPTRGLLGQFQSTNLAPARISLLREELLGEHDALRRQIRRQEDTLRELRTEIASIKRENEKLVRRQNFRARYLSCGESGEEQEQSQPRINHPPPRIPRAPVHDYVPAASPQEALLKSRSLLVPVANGADGDEVDLVLGASLIGSQLPSPHPPQHQASSNQYQQHQRWQQPSTPSWSPREEFQQQQQRPITNFADEPTEDLDQILQEFLLS